MSSCYKRVMVALLCCLAGSFSQASIVTVAAYNLGEDDSGATAGGEGNNPISAFDGKDLIKHGDPVYSSNTPGGGSTFSMSFDDVGDYYSTSAYVLPADNWGIQGWVYASGANNGWAICNGYYLFGTWAGNFRIERAGQGAVFIAAAETGAWHHIALVRNHGTLQAYLDGTAIATTARTDNWGGNYGFAIGGRGDGAELWKGEVDAVQLFTFTAGEFDPDTDLGFKAFPSRPAGTLFVIK